MTTTDMTTPAGQLEALGGDYTAMALFESSPDSVFNALTTPASLTGWWMDASGSGLEGGALTFRWGAEGALVMRVVGAERASRVEWTVLASEPVTDWVGTKVRFDIAPTGSGGARLAFRHIGLTEQLECFEMCKEGWDHYLPSLVGYVDRGEGNPRPAGGRSAAKTAK
jgi:uncharacterized protein YndB with AHSA1/START domain